MVSHSRQVGSNESDASSAVSDIFSDNGSDSDSSNTDLELDSIHFPMISNVLLFHQLYKGDDSTKNTHQVRAYFLYVSKYYL
jgi:hypothetical protein